MFYFTTLGLLEKKLIRGYGTSDKPGRLVNFISNVIKKLLSVIASAVAGQWSPQYHLERVQIEFPKFSPYFPITDKRDKNHLSNI